MSSQHIQAQGQRAEEEPVAGLSAARRALLELRRKKGAKAPAVAAIPRRAYHDHVPLSYAQELLWLLDQLNPNLSVYSVPRGMRISGPLNVDALKRLLDTIVNRHEVLRTTYGLHNGRPVQRIAERASIDFTQVDLSTVPPAAQDEEVTRLFTEAAIRPFDLSRDVMMRALLLRLAPDEHALYMGSHHIASDGWSKSVLFKEMYALYEAYCNGRPSPLPELPIQYADYAVWQRGQSGGEAQRNQLAYWLQQLAGAPPRLELPIDRPRPAVQTFRGSFVRLIFPKSLANACKALGQKEGATLFMVLLAAFDALVYRYTGQADIVVGTPVAGRNRPETEGLIGYFTNTLALRSDVSGNPTYRELLARVRHMALAAYENQDLPFEKLVIELKPERDLSYSPVFQVLFSVGHVGAGAPELPGLTTTPLMVDRGITKFDLTMGITDREDGLSAGFEYSTDLFHATTIRRMLDSFRLIVEAIVTDPDCRVDDLPVLPAAERQRILADWNDTWTDLPADPIVHQLIEAQVRRTPDAPAVVAGNRHLTYRQLNDRANQLAHHLRKRGVGPEVLVGVCTGRSFETAVALLGVLKAGGAYLPLDQAYPKDRLEFMLEDARVSVLLTEQSLRARMPDHRAAVICLDSDWSEIVRESAENPAVRVEPDHPVYVIYTSGSTGRPRGVVVTHRSLVNHNLAVQKPYAIGPTDRVLQFSSLSFDIAVEEIFPTWMAGGAVVLRPPDLPLSGAPFLRWLRENGITVLDLPTAVWHEWVHDLSTIDEPLPEALRLVIVGGEKALPTAFAAWRKAVGNRVRWINTYGPTEGTVIATLHEPGPPAGTAEDAADLPIGRPITNVQTYILDAALQPVPEGVTGDLYLGGLGLARGYLGQPRLTAERFIPDPFGRTPGGRLYRTGDRGKYRADGNIEFQGRADHQVKIRGFRVEPGEIETELCRHSGVREAAVVVRGAAGQTRLVAYVVPNGAAPTARSLQDQLRKNLPEYMIPADIVALAALPKTPNGKVDRRALPEPYPGQGSGRETVAPRDPIEAQLVMIWESVLGVRPIGVRDNFFELGGHSLLAVRLFAQTAKVFGTTLPLATMFRMPTVEQLAEFLRQEESSSYTWDTLIPIQPNGSRPPLFCVAAPTVNALGFVFLARHFDAEQPVYGLQSQYGAKRRQVYSREEYQALAADYIAAMRKIQPRGPYYLAGTCEGAHIAFEMTRQLADGDEAVGLLAMLDAWPLENSTNYFLHAYVHYYASRVRSLLSRGAREVLALAGRKSKRMLRALTGTLHSPPSKSPPKHADCTVTWEVLPEVDDWVARLWPGRDFVPPTIPGRITVFRVEKQAYWRVRDEQLCWGPWAEGGVDVHVIPGRHSTILREPNVRVLVERLSACLRLAQAGTASVNGESAGSDSRRRDQTEAVRTIGARPLPAREE
jgi:amino acid adenylation domain-containing protein